MLLVQCTQLCEDIKYRLKMGIKLEDKKDVIKLDRFKVIVQVCAGEQVGNFLLLINSTILILQYNL